MCLRHPGQRAPGADHGFGIVFAIVWLPILLVVGVVTVMVIAVARRMGFRGRGTPPAPGAPTAPAAPSSPSAPVAPAG